VYILVDQMVSLFDLERGKENFVMKHYSKHKRKTQVKLPTLTCLGKVGEINMEHHVLAIVVCYLGN
jgi:hypothetical protein